MYKYCIVEFVVMFNLIVEFVVVLDCYSVSVECLRISSVITIER